MNAPNRPASELRGLVLKALKALAGLVTVFSSRVESSATLFREKAAPSVVKPKAAEQQGQQEAQQQEAGNTGGPKGP